MERVAFYRSVAANLPSISGAVTSCNYRVFSLSFISLSLMILSLGTMKPVGEWYESWLWFYDPSEPESLFHLISGICL